MTVLETLTSLGCGVSLEVSKFFTGLGELSESG